MIISTRMIIILILNIVSFVGLDVLWLSTMSGFYSKHLSFVGRYVNGKLQPIISTSVLTWLLLVLGIMIFVYPLVRISSLQQSIMYGALYGLVVYGVYEFTNYSIIENWPLRIALIDTLWGITLSAIIACQTWLLQRLLP